MFNKIESSSPAAPAMPIKRILKRIEPIQFGKILGLLYGIMGLLFIPFFLIMSAVSTQLPAGQGIGMMAFGAGFAIVLPLLYAVMGFVFGALGALLYNLAAKWVGGIEVEVE